MIAGRLELIDGDLGVTGLLLTRAVGDLLDNARSVAHERHLALEWLIGRRGGSWFKYSFYCRSASRYHGVPGGTGSIKDGIKDGIKVAA